MPLISPSALLEAHLSQSPPRRPSGRSHDQYRQVDLNVGSLAHCNGSSVVKIGDTTIVCGVRAEILPVSDIPHFRTSKTVAPKGKQTQRASSGSDLDQDDDSNSDEDDSYETIALNQLLVPNIELSTGCHPRYPANSPPSILAQSTSQRLLSLLHTSLLVRTADLEIWHYPSPSDLTDLDPDDPAFVAENTQPQLKAYWVLYIDMMCVSFGGSVFDTAWLALLAALTNTRLPRAWWDQDEGRVFCSPNISEASKLRLRGMPVPLSFAVFVPGHEAGQVQGVKGEDGADRKKGVILFDPDMFEEEVCSEKGCVTVDGGAASGDQCRLLRVEKNGGGVVDVQATRGIVSIAATRWDEFKAKLARAVEQAQL